MTPHGPDTTTYESAIAPEAEAPAHLGRDTLAFMFETTMTPRVTPAALGATNIDRCVCVAAHAGCHAFQGYPLCDCNNY